MRLGTAVFLLTAALPAGLFGQSNGAVTGVILDPSGAAVKGARVSLTNSATGIVSNAASNESGVYSFPSVLIGQYDVQIEAGGFKRHVQNGLTVETGQSMRLDVTLQIGAAQESVTVSADAPLLQQETSSVGTQVSQTMLNQLPFQLSGSMRNPIAFLRLTPGATGQSSSAGDTRIAGGRGQASEVFVDGVQVTYNASQSVADIAHPAYDTISEFRVEAVLPPAEYGRTSGGVVIMSSRTGTNEFHGNALLLVRNNVLDARRYNAAIADISRQFETAASLGGPVWIPKLYQGRNRTFFFGNFTGFRRVNVPQGANATVATQAMRGGDFAANAQRIFDPLTANAAGQRQQFPGNVIPANRISNYAKAFNAATPLPNVAGFANNYLGGSPLKENSEAGFIRLDHQIVEAHRVSGSYRIQNRFRARRFGALPVLDDIIDGPDTRNLTTGYDWIVRPTVVNRLQFGYTWFKNVNRTTIADLGLQVPGAFRPGTPAAAFAGQGMSQLGYDETRTPFNFNWNIQESLSWTTGKHTFKFGGRYDRYYSDFAPRQNEAGTYTFSQFATSQPQVANTGHSYASFLLGLVNNAALAKALAQEEKSRYFAVFAQDDWKIRRNLTLNLGLRWEMQEPWFEPQGRVSNMNPALPNPGAANVPGAMEFAGDGTGRIGGKRFMLTDLNNFSPRVGLAYQLSARTVLRAGYGIMYAPLVGADLNRQGFNANVSVASQDGGLTPAFLIDQGWPAGLVKPPPFIDPTVANNQNTALIERRRGGSGAMPLTQQWQFNLQRTVGGMLIDSSYVATMGHGITNGALVRPNQLDPKYLSLGTLLTRNINDPLVQAAGYRAPYAGFTGTLAQSLRAFPQYQNLTATDTPTGNSTYHALLVKAEKRLSKGLHFLAAYALSKTLTDISFIGADLAAPQDQFNRRAEKSLPDTDIPQVLTLSYSYELPLGKGKRWLSGGAGSLILGGWSVAGIHTYSGGSPLRVTIPNNLPIFGGHLRPNRVAGETIRVGPGRGEFEPFNGLTGQTGDAMLNRNAFALPSAFTFGNLGVFLPDVRGFGSASEDLSVMKRFAMGERARFELRGDLFNAFNRRNLNNPVTDFTNPNFGRITGQGAARVIQVGCRIDF